MTGRDTVTHPFHPFFNTFQAPLGETLKLRSRSFSLFTDMNPEKPDTLELIYGLVPRQKRFIYLTDVKGITCLSTNVYEAEIKAANWEHLADQLEQMKTGLFPKDLLELFWQVGGREDHQNRFALHDM